MKNIRKKINFGPKFIKTIKLCYAKIETAVMNNGHSTGIRQGYPLSGSLFIIVAEVLAQSIRNKEQIQGLEIEKFIIKLKQFGAT